MSWLKKATHGIAHTVGKAAGKITGSHGVEKAVEKGVKYIAPLGSVAGAYQTAHVLGHVGDTFERLKNPKAPEAPSIEMPDYSEYLAQQAEYLAQMQAAMSRVEPAQEPLKAAQQEMSAARSDTDRKQLLRRGLMSTYTRYGSQGGTQRLGA